MMILWIFICLMLLILLFTQRRQFKQEILQIRLTLAENAQGNLQRKAITRSAVTEDLVFKINQINQKYSQDLRELELELVNQNELITSLSHDIRTPLATLLGYLQALEERNLSEAEQEAFLATALNKSIELQGFIDDLFEWFKLSANDKIYNFEMLDVVEMTRSVLISWLQQFAEKQIEYQLSFEKEEIFLSLDKNSYFRILNNLLQNAINHGKATEIRLLIREQNNAVRIEIEDNGQGIPEKQLPRIFDRFFQGDVSRSSHGSGLGLAIVKELVEKNHGIIEAQSSLDVGSSFQISFFKK